MSGAYGYPPFVPQRPRVAVSRLVAATLLVVAAGLVVGGSFGAFSVYRFDSPYSGATTTTTTGWGTTQHPAPEEATASLSVLHGIPLTVAALLGLVAALLLLLSARRPGDPAPGRLLGVGAAGLLVGVVAEIWLELLTLARNVAAFVEDAGSAAGYRTSLVIGVGGYLILVAGLAALAAAVLLLVPRRDGGPGPFPPAPVPPYGPAHAPWAVPPPGQAAPGWGPPPPGWRPPHG